MRRAVRWLVEHPEAGLFLEPGLGKTSITLAALQLLRRHGVARRVLVVAPLQAAYQVWSHRGEVGRWTDFAGLRVALLHGKDREAAAASDADLYVVNYEGLGWLTESGALDRLLARGADTLVMDELSKLRHTRTVRFRTLRPFLHRFKRRWGLTGTPVANHLVHLFGQIYCLDLGRRLGSRVTWWRFEHFLPTGYGGHTWVPKDGAEARIYQRLGDLALAMRTADHADMPALVERNVWVDLPPEARRVYDELEDELFTLLDDESVTAANAAVASMKCRQVASGGLYLAGHRAREIHGAKTEALLDLVDELQGEPLLLLYEFQHDLARLRAGLRYEVPALGGGQTPEAIAALADAWNRGELPVLAGQPQAMGHGLNLQHAGHHVAFFTTPWDFELYDQVVRRVWRPGNRHAHVTVHRLLARDTVDEVVVNALARKKRGHAALFAALRERRATR